MDGWLQALEYERISVIKGHALHRLQAQTDGGAAAVEATSVLHANELREGAANIR